MSNNKIINIMDYYISSLNIIQQMVNKREPINIKITDSMCESYEIHFDKFRDNYFDEFYDDFWSKYRTNLDGFIDFFECALESIDKIESLCLNSCAKDTGIIKTTLKSKKCKFIKILNFSHEITNLLIKYPTYENFEIHFYFIYDYKINKMENWLINILKNSNISKLIVHLYLKNTNVINKILHINSNVKELDVHTNYKCVTYTNLKYNNKITNFTINGHSSNNIRMMLNKRFNMLTFLICIKRVKIPKCIAMNLIIPKIMLQKNE